MLSNIEKEFLPSIVIFFDRIIFLILKLQSNILNKAPESVLELLGKMKIDLICIWNGL